MNFKKVSVIGLGYIGLPTAAMFASRKIEVVGIDVNPHVVETINRGEIHLVEPDLDMIVRAAVSEGFLRASLNPEPADAFLIAVPTPFKGENHDPDLSYVKSATLAIAPVLKSGDIVILESTSPVGTTEEIEKWLMSARPDLTFPSTHGENSAIRMAHCPERVLPGHVLRELVENDRVIGGMTSKCTAAAIALYKIFVKGSCVETNSRTAEMVKLTENSFRDVNIAFANELSIICDKLDINVWELIRLANRHPRVNILNPGPGVGGHCIAVDPWFIISQSPKESRLIRASREVNDSKPHWVLNQIKSCIQKFLSENPTKEISQVRVACYGLSFKADIDDLRESPAIEIVQDILRWHQGPLLVVEPHISQLPKSLLKADLVSEDVAFSGADVHVFLVDHQAFKKYASKAKPIFMIDTRGLWK